MCERKRNPETDEDNTMERATDHANLNLLELNRDIIRGRPAARSSGSPASCAGTTIACSREPDCPPPTPA